jgi:KaiC/GvpD/RAD55 family RecA-like ATPase
MMSTIHVDVPGLDLVLGGGIRAISRADGLRESATLLMRGPAGAGKSIFGTQLAGALGRALKCDVAYGCVELLPFELRAQHEGFERKDERVIVPPFVKEDSAKTKKEGCRIFAAVLDIGSSESGPAQLGTAILNLLGTIKQFGGDPRVLVIDSLSDGYHLGASAPRDFADALCKLAADQGMFLILLEETATSQPSVWSFATDIVIQLDAIEEDLAPGILSTSDRSMKVIKNRFAPSGTGAHRFGIAAAGVSVFPHPSSYLAPWARNLIVPAVDLSPMQDWSIPKTLSSDWRPFRSCVTAVYGSDATAVFELVNQLGTKSPEDGPFAGGDVFLDFAWQEPDDIEMFDMQGGGICVPAGNRFLSIHKLLSQAVNAIRTVHDRSSFVRRVLIGDFRSMRNVEGSRAIGHGIVALITILRRASIPAILFETTRSRVVREQGFANPPHERETGADEPAVVDVADVVIEIRSSVNGPLVYTISEIRKGLRSQWHGPVPKERASQ